MRLVMMAAVLGAGGGRTMADALEDVAREALGPPADGSAYVLKSRYRSASNGVTHFCFQRSIDGLPVMDGDLLVNLRPGGEVLNLHRSFPLEMPVGLKKGLRFSPEAALERAAERVGLAETRSGGRIGRARGEAGTWRFAGGEMSEEPMAVEAVWHRDDAGVLRKAWRVRIQPREGKHLWDVVIADSDGAELERKDRVLRSGSYRVFPLPLEDALDGPSLLLAGVEDALASPFGWHDTNGAAGAEFTDTRGNNLDAFEDRDGNDSGGLRPTGGAGLVFDYPSNPALGGFADRNAAIVHAFYVSNVCHDLFYRYGFDEPAGNFQQNSYGRGGLGNDRIRLQTEEPDALRNAFFFPTVDGGSSKMEFGMVPMPATLTITAPAPVAGNYLTRAPEIGSWTSETGFSAEIVAAVDEANAAGPSTADCCSTPTNAAALAGKIALIDRGGCFFDDKIKLAELAGAVGVIIVNRTDPTTTPPRNGQDLVTMQGDDYTLQIPGIFIRESDGATIRAALGGPGGPVMANFVSPVRNNALDTTLVIHEYGHGVSSRLTGGPANAFCLDGLVSGGLGEGWSDFFAVALTAKPDDDSHTPRPIGAYTDPPTGFRRFPYSADRSVNPLSYVDIGVVAQVHAIGEVWCQALWDLHWELVRARGFSADLSAPHTAGGNNLAIQLVIDGLKLQPCDPSFIDARDAILLADQALTGGANQFSIWNAFARRGLGENADEGSGGNDITINESFAVPALLDMADDDLDGTENLLEAALGGSPVLGDPEILPELTLVTVGADVYPAIRHRRLKGGSGTAGLDYTVDGITYTAEVDDDLSGFASGAGLFVLTAINPGPGENMETVTLRTTTSLEDAEHQFLRLRVTRTGS